MNKEIVLASNNKDKLREFRAILSSYGIKVLSQSEVGVDLEVEETGKSYIENAMLKAKALFDIVQRPVIADDSGIEVDCLDGRPGLFSARYAPEPERCEKLLAEMGDTVNRGASYITAVCYIDKDIQVMEQYKGRGHVTTQRQGTNGFAYDSIFYYDKCGKTFAEMSFEEKSNCSVRKCAIDLVLNRVKAY